MIGPTLDLIVKGRRAEPHGGYLALLPLAGRESLARLVSRRSAEPERDDHPLAGVGLLVESVETKRWKISKLPKFGNFMIVVQLIFCPRWPVNHLYNNKEIVKLG